jgi:DNA-directed RNA polymerase specialized sigma24 family protein
VALEDLAERLGTHQDFGGVGISEILRRCLTPREHQVVKLKIDGFKEREIAKILQIHPGTVATLFHRAREKLRECLGRQETG